MSEAMPPKEKHCHRTGFEKKCIDLVCVQGICDRWKTLTVQDAAGNLKEQGNCIDDWQFYWGFANERGLNQAAASTDKVANAVTEFAESVERSSSVGRVLTLIQQEALAKQPEQPRIVDCTKIEDVG